MRPDISNVCTPDGVRRCQVIIKDVVKLAAEIGVSCSGSPWSYPLDFNAHLFHVSSNGPLGNTDTGFTKFPADFRGTIVLVELVINLLDHPFDRFLTLTGDRHHSVKESMIAGT